MNASMHDILYLKFLSPAKKRKFKYALYLFACTNLFSFPAYAFLSSSPYFDGFYVGANGGILQTQGDLRLNEAVSFQRPGPPFMIPNIFTLPIITSVDLYNDSALGAIHIGYGHALGQTPLYLSAELYGSLASRNVNTQISANLSEFATQAPLVKSYTADLTNAIKASLNSGEFGIDARPGIFLSPFAMLYGRVGAAFNHIKLQSNANLTLVNLTDPDTKITNLFSGNSKQVTGLRLGAGFEERVNNHWGISADYIYTNYGHIAANAITDTINLVETTTPTIPNGFRNQTSMDITSQAALVGVNYYFGSADQDAFFPLDPQCIHGFNGFYAGLKGGALQNRVETNLNSSASFIFGGNFNTRNLAYSENADLRKNAGTGSAFLGYGHLLNNSLIYLGGEAFINYASSRNMNENFNIASEATGVSQGGNNAYLIGNLQTKLNTFEWGADIRPGIMLTGKTLFYGRVGVAINKFQTNSSDVLRFTTLIIHPPATIDSTLFQSRSKTIAAPRFGVGTEEYLGKHISVNADYIYTIYGTQHINVVGSTAAFSSGVPIYTLDGFKTAATVKMSNQMALIGLTYHASI